MIKNAAMIRNRIAIALALALFLVLAGTGAGNALWSMQASTTASVKAGVIGVTQANFSSLGHVYGSASLSDTAYIRVRNSGTITAPYTLTFSAPATNSLATGVQVRTWPVSGTTNCSATSTVPTAASDSNWTNVPSLTGTLAPGASAYYCVRTSITSPQQTSLAATSMTATLSLTSAVGNWTKTVTASATQSVADTAAPTAPGTPIASSTTDAQTTLTWAASSENVAVTAYDVYRDGALVGSATSTSYTVTGLNVGTTYTFTVAARDAAGNTSSKSGATSVTTSATVDSARWYTVVNPASNKCVDAQNSSTATGTPLIISACDGGSNQSWKFTAVTGGYKVTPRYSSGLVWDIMKKTLDPNDVDDGLADGNDAQLWSYGGGTNQQWTIKQVSPLGSGIYYFVNINSGKCLDVEEASVAEGARLQQWSCNVDDLARRFTLTAVAG